MEGVKQWAFSICAAMVACGLAQMILPQGSMEKVFRTTVSVFFLCCLLSPVVLRNPGLRIEVREAAEAEIADRAQRLTREVEFQAGESAGQELKKIIGEKLAQKGIKHHGITISMNRNGQSEEAALSALIYLDERHKPGHDRILAMLTEELGIEIRLQYREE